MTKQEKAIREFCGHHADWWPSTTQVQEMLALAQPEQEPVAWITPDGEGFRIRFSPPVNDVPLGWDALYTTPPHRTWVGLTEEELCEIVGVSTNDSDWNVYKVQEWLRKVEAKLKHKNT